jgi:cell division transport system permease protein
VLSRIAYAFRETGSNLRRNFTLTAASLITVVVSLTLVGVSLLIRQAVDNALVRWKGGVEFIVFMKPDATADQLAAVNRDLDENPQVKAVRFVDKPEAYEEFKTLFPDSPELTESLQIEQMPPSYRVVPLTDDSTVVGALGTQFEGKPGVFAVEYSKEALDWLRSISRFLGVGLIIAAGVLLVAAVLLIWNTIRTAIFARRREVEVMKLVGATNWFIRVPFMLEGLVQGIVGAVAACVGVWSLNAFWKSRVIDGIEQEQLKALVVSASELQFVFIVVLVVGALAGAIGSAVAVTRYLQV